MSRIDQQTVQRIFDTADIVEVVADFVQLKRRGANFVGLCPFHNERTPSFYVSRAKGICKCFSCGKGGNVVNFLMEHEQLSYGEALRWLARKYGIEIKEKELTDDERRREQRREAAIGALQQATDIYARNLAANPDAEARLRQRGIDATIAAAYRLGLPFPAATPGTLCTTLAATMGITPDAIAAAALSVPDVATPGAITDAITGGDGVVFPIVNRYGKTIALTSFGLDDSAGRQQFRLYAPETMNPDDEFAGIFQARQGLATSHTALIAAAPQLLLQTARAGISNAIAMISDPFTDRRVATIRRFASDVILLLPHNLYWDGYNFMARANRLLSAGVGVKVAAAHLSHPSLQHYIDNTDSDSVADGLITNASDIVSFKLHNRRRLLDATPDPQRRREYDRYLTDDLFDTLRAVADDILLQVYVETVGDHLKLTENNIRRRIRP